MNKIKRTLRMVHEMKANARDKGRIVRKVTSFKAYCKKCYQISVEEGLNQPFHIYQMKNRKALRESYELFVKNVVNAKKV